MLLNSNNNQKNAGKRAVYFAGKGIQETDEKTISNESSTNTAKHSRLDDVPIKTSFQQMIKSDNESEKNIITKDEIEALRSSVLQLNRPRNPWFETQKPFKKSNPSVSNESQPIKHLVRRGATSDAPLPNVLVEEKQPSKVNAVNGNANNRDVYEAKPVKVALRQNASQHPIHESTKKNANDDSLKRYASIPTGLSLKQQLLQQQQNISCAQGDRHQHDFDISRALASDIKMLEQLEIEHLRRANNRLLGGADTQSNPSSSGSESGGHITHYNSNAQNISPIQRINHRDFEKNNYKDSQNSAEWYNRGSKYTVDDGSRNGSDSGNHSNVTLHSTGFTSSPSPSSMRNITCSPRHQNIKPEAKIVGRKFSADNSHSLTPPRTKLWENEENTNHSYSICTTCHQPINEVILQALGMSYHASCFRCAKCSCCLDGVPFAVDTTGKVFCMDDYENMFIPACVACGKSISAINEFGQIIRVVFRNEEYHIDCFNCEGCGLQLSNEEHNRCFPISSHLLCRRCHVQWKRLGGIDQPITDL